MIFSVIIKIQINNPFIGKEKSWPSYIASSFSMTIAKGRDASYDALPQLLLLNSYAATMK